MSSQPSYHSVTITPPLSKELYTIETADLIHDIDVFVNLRASLLSGDTPEPTLTNSIEYVDMFLDRAITEVERRFSDDKRTKLRRGWGTAWPQRSRLEEMKAIAEEMKSRLSIADYLDRYVPWAVLNPMGDRLRGRCPYPDHDDRTASFVVFPDDHAWCFGCQRGGDLFRVVALIEGIPVFRHQLQYVADLLGTDEQELSRGA